MGDLKIIRMSDIKRLSEAEIEALRTAKRKEYAKMLLDLCPSKNLRKQAKRLSKQKGSCGMCVYCDDESSLCWYPHSDIYIEELNVDPCYEGVLRFLVAETEKANEIKKIREALEELMLESPKSVIELVIDDFYSMCTLTGWIIMMAEQNWQMPPDVIETVRNLYYSLTEAFSPTTCNSDGGDDNEQ